MRKNSAFILYLFLISLIISACSDSGAFRGNRNAESGNFEFPEKISLSKEKLMDKIMGGWAGQAIGVTYGGPTEFKFNGLMIPDSFNIPWPESGYAKDWFDNRSWLYDDIYMDLTFVEVFEEYGLDASVDKFANAFAHAEYPLWHANQAARYNILHGIMPPESGFWKNNPHADDIDFQIESDFAGLMSPAMPVTASEICDKIGHIMNYGDGWYGGVYVSAMYSLAFITDDIDVIVREALKMIPEQSDFYALISDMIAWSEENENWKDTWRMLQEKWSNEETCPKGYSIPFTIEAKMNSAYILMGLLYGEGDMGKTIEISTRCGADSDCNPSNAAGILGTALGYKNIPGHWLNNIKEVEDQNFPFTDLSLRQTYRLSFEHALELIKKNGGNTGEEEITIAVQKPEAVKFEQSFPGLIPVKKEILDKQLSREKFSYSFHGSGILISAEYPGKRGSTGDYTGTAEIYSDGNLVKTVELPADFKRRKLDLYWNFDLPTGDHTLEVKLLNPDEKHPLIINYLIVYDEKEDINP